MSDARTGSAGAGGPVAGLVDHHFRHTSGRLVASLTRWLGPRHLDLVEEAVQDALVRALEVWPWRGVPDNPAAWLLQVARRRALDRLRRDAAWRRTRDRIESGATGPTAEAGPSAPAGPLDPLQKDDELVMVLMCCHPDLPPEARVALTMKTLGGFSVAEIARAFLTSEPTIAQRLVRAKRVLRERRIVFERPGGDDLLARLDSALDVVYLMFNEGYGAYEGDSLTRADLVEEAIRLAAMLAADPATGRPEVHALLALMYLQASRLPARTHADGRLATLDEQDRTKWDRGLAAAGLRHLARASEGDRITAWHLEAGIAAMHASAATRGDTDWPRILALYDELVALAPSPVVALNRAVAVARARGPRAGLDAALEAAAHPALAGYYLAPATLAQLWEECGDAARAAAEYARALALVRTAPERRFLEARLARVRP